MGAWKAVLNPSVVVCDEVIGGCHGEDITGRPVADRVSEVSPTPISVTSTDGESIAVHDLGGTGPDVFIVHATGFCGRAYESFAAALGDRFHCYGVDLRGHGDSPAPRSGNFSWDALAADLLAVFDHFGAGSARVFGHSVGGAAALLAEAARPGSVARAFLYEPVVFPTGYRHPGGESPMAGPARRRREVFASRAEALARYATRPPLGHLRADCLAAYVEHGFEDLPDGTVRLKCRAESEASVFSQEETVTIDRMATVASQVVVAQGTRNTGPGPARSAPMIAEQLPNATLLPYPHLAHLGPLQDPETVAQDVAGFFS